MMLLKPGEEGSREQMADTEKRGPGGNDIGPGFATS